MRNEMGFECKNRDMKNAFSILFVLLYIMTGCESRQSAERIVAVDVTKNYPKKELILQDFMDVEYIPLETTDDFITFGNIQVIDKEIIITRNAGRGEGNLFLYNTDGKGLRIINRLGQGGEEYINMGAIAHDEANGELYVNSSYQGRMLVYDLLGNFKRSLKQSQDYPIYGTIGVFDQNHLICHDTRVELSMPDVKRNCFLIISKVDGSIVEEVPIPYGDKKPLVVLKKDAEGRNIGDFGIRNRALIPYKKNWVLVEPSADTIYQYSTDRQLTPMIVRTPSVQTMNPEIFLFPSVFTDRYWFMRTIKRTFNFTTDKECPGTNLVYDRQEDAIFECVIYNDDYVDKTLANLCNNIYTSRAVNNDEIAFVDRLEANDLIEAYKNGKLKGKLKQVAAGLTEDSNPVIMLVKYKK